MRVTEPENRRDYGDGGGQLVADVVVGERGDG